MGSELNIEVQKEVEEVKIIISHHDVKYMYTWTS